jgi:hypothetical protein
MALETVFLIIIPLEEEIKQSSSMRIKQKERGFKVEHKEVANP